MNSNGLKDLAFRDWANSVGAQENPTPAQLEAFMRGYVDFMESYNDAEETDPQAT